MPIKRERGEGGLFKMKGSRMWYGQWYRNGKPVRVSLKTDVKEEAKRRLRKKMTESESGAAPENEVRKLRYGKLRETLLDDYNRRGNKSLQTLVDGSETIWGLSELDKYFGYSKTNDGMLVSAINVDIIRKFVRKRQADKIGNAAINRNLAMLRRMFNLARMERKISAIPLIQLLKEPPARKGFLERDKFELVLSKLSEPLRPLVIFLYYCGVRLGEARQIEWGQVDLATGLIRLEEEQTKTSEARMVPMPEVLIRLLKPIEPKQGKVFSDSGLRNLWPVAVKQAEMPNLLIHDLRRSAIRNLIQAGVPEKVAMQISGHRTRAVFDRYHIVSSQDVLSAMQKLTNHENSESLVRAGK